MKIQSNNETVQFTQSFPHPHLTNYGGKVLEKPVFASLFLGKYWKSASGSADKTRLDAFGKFLPQSAYTSVWKEYGGGKGRFIGSRIVDDRLNRKAITDAEVQTTIRKVIPSFTKDPETVFTLFLPPGMKLIAPDGTTSRQGMGGYHMSFDDPKYGRVYYSAIVYSEGSNGVNFTGKPLDNITTAVSHEWSEAVTDPDVNAGALGWYDRNLGEVGDIPVTLANDVSDVIGNLGSFTVQMEWSNRLGRAVIRE